ncbi:TPA: hypothetical protein UL581_004137 [Klebsiella pneumoniae]|nr:hypothetical protein [Klebsiella pneumoniae]
MTDITELAQSLKRRAASANEFGESLYVKADDVIALVEALEKAQRANGYLREQSAEWERKAISNFEDCAEMSARVEELESQRKLAFTASNRWADKFREAEHRIASLESAGELSIREQKFLKLAKAYQQLAAESVTMLRLLTDISDNHVECFSEGEGYMFAGVPLDYVSEINMYVSRDVNAENPFPATDRIVAAQRSAFVDEAVAKITESGALTFGDCIVALCQLREGAK